VEDEEFFKFYQNIKPKLPLSLMGKIESFKFPADQQRSLIANLMVRQFYSKQLKINWKEIEFDHNEHDKPSLLKIEENFFNISHSGNQVVAAFSDKELGIDVEKIKGDRRKIAKRFFTPSEIEDLEALENEEEQMHYFYQLWTLKESYMKAIGSGMTMSLSSFAFKKERSEFKLAFSSQDMDWHFHSPEWTQGYYLSVCSKYNDTPIVEKKKLSDIRVYL
jgi:4'-phosphopantetheinyl transferase